MEVMGPKKATFRLRSGNRKPTACKGKPAKLDAHLEGLVLSKTSVQHYTVTCVTVVDGVEGEEWLLTTLSVGGHKYESERPAFGTL